MPPGRGPEGSTVTAATAAARRALVWALVTAAVAAGLVLLWQLRRSVALIAAGVLVAIFLRRLAIWVARRSSLRYGWALALVVVGLLTAMVAGLWWRGPALADEVGRLQEELPRAVERLRERVASQGWGRVVLDRAPDAEDLLGDRQETLSRATGLLTGVLGVLGDLLIVVLTGLFLAATPGAYVRGILHLVPFGRRPRAREVMVEVEETLSRWLLSKVLRMILVGALTWGGLLLLGVPLALTLGLIAGVLTFVPNIGPILALAPALLLALMQSSTQALYVLALYVGIQQFENYVVTPLLEKRMLSLPPALTFAMQVFLGVLVGPMGVALATPLTAGGIVLVRTLYVEDVLGDHAAGG